jgi:hypothetical protein
MRLNNEQLIRVDDRSSPETLAGDMSVASCPVTDEASSDDPQETLRLALLREERRVDLSAQVQFTRSAYWNALNIILSLVTALLAGIAGLSSLTEVAGQISAGILALAAGALAAVNSALSAERRSSAATAVANDYIEIRDALRQVRLLDLPIYTEGRSSEEFRELTSRVHAVNKSAPITGRWAWWSAKRRQRRRLNEDEFAGDCATVEANKDRSARPLRDR